MTVELVTDVLKLSVGRETFTGGPCVADGVGGGAVGVAVGLGVSDGVGEGSPVIVMRPLF